MVLRLLKEKMRITPTETFHVSMKNITKSYDQYIDAVSGLTLEIRRGEFFSLLGPSGCGKTTILRILAGLEVPDKGSVKIGDISVAGEAWIPPEKRGVGIVFQDYALFPHMTIFENIAFGLKGCSKKEQKERVMEQLEMVGIIRIANCYPHELSGGQQQRVALARAIVLFPKVMLLDEPFSSLDADLRLELRQETRKILKEKNITTILVTHDQEEAFSLSDRVGVLDKGKLEQVGTPDEIYHKPETRFVANFVGRADFVRGFIQDNVVSSDIGIFKCNDHNLYNKEEVDLMIRPDDVDFTVNANGDAVITESQFLGASVIYTLRMPGGKIIHSMKPSTQIKAVGTKVRIDVDPVHIIIFPSTGGNRSTICFEEDKKNSHKRC